MFLSLVQLHAFEYNHLVFQQHHAKQCALAAILPVDGFVLRVMTVIVLE